MTVCSLALRRGRGLGCTNKTYLRMLKLKLKDNHKSDLRYLSTANAVRKSDKEDQRESPKLRGFGKHDKFKNRDFFLSVLGSSATKRDARAYLQRFAPPKPAISSKLSSPAEKNHGVLQKHGVNLGTLFGAGRAVENSPKFSQQSSIEKLTISNSEQIHIALVKIRTPQNIDDRTLRGIAITLSQLAELGLISVVVIDCEDLEKGIEGSNDSSWRTFVTRQTDRIAELIDSSSTRGARQVMNIIGSSKDDPDSFVSSTFRRGQTSIAYRELLMKPLRKGVIPVLAPIAYTKTTQRVVAVEANEVILALTREFAGFQISASPDEPHETTSSRLKAVRNQVSIDRLIVLDPCGGIPSDREGGFHVFLNLEHEYELVKHFLRNRSSTDTEYTNIDPITSSFGQKMTDYPKSPMDGGGDLYSLDTQPKILGENIVHLQNLELTRQVLSLLPPNSSALLTTAREAANLGKINGNSDQIGVGTRRQRNPLIHNLLTDKPVFSSSLPSHRIIQLPSDEIDRATSSLVTHPTTFAKRGMSVTIYPDPKFGPWAPCLPGEAPLTLNDPKIDLSRLVHLIDDSFNRSLDVPAYLKRVNDRIAGVIIAGEYEGGALLTWELPPGVPDDGSEASRQRMVPYLDKFAVLKRAQGAGGVADILFTAMVRDCFPSGVCWRSRRDNPVNKWYFERSRGTWKIPETNWTMFWTTEGVESDTTRFSDYAGVSRSIIPTWKDGKSEID